NRPAPGTRAGGCTPTPGSYPLRVLPPSTLRAPVGRGDDRGSVRWPPKGGTKRAPVRRQVRQIARGLCWLASDAARQTETDVHPANPYSCRFSILLELNDHPWPGRIVCRCRICCNINVVLRKTRFSGRIRPLFWSPGKRRGISIPTHRKEMCGNW